LYVTVGNTIFPVVTQSLLHFTTVLMSEYMRVPDA